MGSEDARRKWCLFPVIPAFLAFSSRKCSFAVFLMKSDYGLERVDSLKGLHLIKPTQSIVASCCGSRRSDDCGDEGYTGKWESRRTPELHQELYVPPRFNV